MLLGLTAFTYLPRGQRGPGAPADDAVRTFGTSADTSHRASGLLTLLVLLAVALPSVPP